MSRLYSSHQLFQCTKSLLHVSVMYNVMICRAVVPKLFYMVAQFQGCKNFAAPCCSPIATGGISPQTKCQDPPNRNRKHYKPLEYFSNFQYSNRNCGAWTLLLLAVMVRSFAHLPLGISALNTGRITDSARTWELFKCNNFCHLTWS